MWTAVEQDWWPGRFPLSMLRPPEIRSAKTSNGGYASPRDLSLPVAPASGNRQQPQHEIPS